MSDVPLMSDAGNDQFVRIGTIPTSGVTAVTATVDTATFLTISITTTPQKLSLSLWDFLLTMRVDTDDSAHEWPYGASLTSTTLSVRMYHWTDWANSNDARNVRKNRIVIENFSGSTRTIYLKFKSYTFAYVVGSSA